MKRCSFGDIAGLATSLLVRGRGRRAPALVAIPEGRLAAAIERCELAALFWARADLFGRWRDPAFRRVGRVVSRWGRLERLMGVLRDYNWRVETKRAVLADPERRAELREALGGDAAMARWEAAWARRADADEDEPRGEGCGLRGCDCVACGGEFTGYDFGDDDGAEDGGGSASGTPADQGSTEPAPDADVGESRDPSLGEPDRSWNTTQDAAPEPGDLPEGAWMRDTFRLASRPVGNRSRGSRRSGRRDPGVRRDERKTRRGARTASRIPVWPSELAPPCPARDADGAGSPVARPRPVPESRGVRGWRPVPQNPYAGHDRLFPP